MAGAALSDFLNRLRRVAVPRSGGEVLDPDLLERFVADHDEAAFTALVQRHGPMVLGVCRHAADDADFDSWATRQFGTDRQRRPKGVVEVIL